VIVGAVACAGSAELDLGPEHAVVPTVRTTEASGKIQLGGNRIYMSHLRKNRPVQNADYVPEMVLSRKSLGQSTESVHTGVTFGTGRRYYHRRCGRTLARTAVLISNTIGGATFRPQVVFIEKFRKGTYVGGV